MNSITDLLSPHNYLSFVKKNMDRDINIIHISSANNEDLRVYNVRLKRLQLLLNNYDPSVDIGLNNIVDPSFFTNSIEIQKEIILVLYYISNPHIIRQYSYQEYSYYLEYVGDIVDYRTRHITDVRLGRKVRLFSQYLNLLSYMKTEWYIDRVKDSSKPPPFDTISSPIESKSVILSTITNKFEENNRFFKEFGFFTPSTNIPGTRFFIENRKLFDIKLSQINFINFDFDRLLKTENESQLEFELLKVLRATRFIFGMNITLQNQILQRLESLKIKTYAKPDINIGLQDGFFIPIEVKFKDMRKVLDDFKNTRNKRCRATKNMIKMFSQLFHQMLTCRSKIGFLTDGTYCVAIILKMEPLVDKDNISVLREVKCDIEVFDANNYQINVAIFIMMVVRKFQNNAKINDDEFKKYHESFTISEKEKNRRTKKQYEKLNEFCRKLFDVQIYMNDYPTFNSSDLLTKTEDSDEEAEIVHSEMFAEINKIEVNFMEESNVRLNLRLYGKALRSNEFEILDISKVQVEKILSGDIINTAYSTVICTSDSEIFKVYDPIRIRMEREIDSPTFYHRLKDTYNIFIREISTYIFLKSKGYKHMPDFVGMGYLTNDNRSFCNKLSVRLSDDGILKGSLSGFFIKMKKAPGLTMDNVKWNAGIAQQLKSSLMALHKLNVSHGDLHKKNVLYDEATKTVTLIDFGQSKLARLRGLNRVQFEEGVKQLEKRKDWDTRNLSFMIESLSK
ncbi:hypothetical protein DFJ63DRAFT_316201 [Scheffersomyces coipomensis]|uniref:uncharacterized protein n=1 Tax=Scheffersomyces coipomensis TaxID=1788519 RepID=UPI00315C60EA